MSHLPDETQDGGLEAGDAPFPWQPDESTNLSTVAVVRYLRDMNRYVRSFHVGAETLFKAIVDGQQPADWLVFPLAFILRHSMELALKQVIRAGLQLLDEPGDFESIHDLGRLWRTCQPLLLRIWGDDPKLHQWVGDPAFNQVSNVISSLDAIDPHGNGFRYPEQSERFERRPTLEGLSLLDLGKMYDEVIGVLTLMESADGSIELLGRQKNRSPDGH
jgi:hypothetical protein